MRCTPERKMTTSALSPNLESRRQHLVDNLGTSRDRFGSMRIMEVFAQRTGNADTNEAGGKSINKGECVCGACLAR